jgi:hypothetical protein
MNIVSIQFDELPAGATLKVAYLKLA